MTQSRQPNNESPSTEPPEKDKQGSIRDLIGRTIQGKYKIIAPIAKGGMGQIYRAEQIPLGRQVAVKVMHAIDQVNMEKRFILEASIHARLEHPHTVRIYDFGRTTSNLVFIAMELLHGHTLKEEINNGPIETKRVVNFAMQLCGALYEAHLNEIVHRDIKPSNIFLIQHEKTFAKLLDFGLVKSLNVSTSLSQTGMIMGSPMYMAPEQIEGKPVDQRTDIYGLGMTLYHAICGQAPFTGELNQVLMAHIVKMPPAFIHHLPLESINQNLEWIVFKAIQKDPNDRFQSMQQMRQALKLCAMAIKNNQECSLDVIENEVVSTMGSQINLAHLGRSEFEKRQATPQEDDTLSPSQLYQKRRLPRWFPTLVVICAILILFSSGIIGGIYLYQSLHETNSQPHEQIESKSTLENRSKETEKRMTIDSAEAEAPKSIPVLVSTSRPAKAYRVENGIKGEEPICATPCTIEVMENESKNILISRNRYRPETIIIDGSLPVISVELKRMKSKRSDKQHQPEELVTPLIYK